MNPLSIEAIELLLIPGVKVSNEKKLDVIDRVEGEYIYFKEQGQYLRRGIASLIKDTLWNIVK